MRVGSVGSKGEHISGRDMNEQGQDMSKDK